MDIGSVFMGIAIGYILYWVKDKFFVKPKGQEYYQCTACRRPVIENHKPQICPRCSASNKMIKVLVTCTPIAEGGKRKRTGP